MRVDNVQGVSDITLRNLNHKISPETQNMSMGNPRVTSLELRSIHQKFSQTPTDFINLNKPRVLSLALRNLYNKLKPQEESIFVTMPSITFLEVRPLLQRLRTWDLDHKITVNLPDTIEIYKKGVVTSYDSPDFVDFKIGTPEPVSIEVKGIYNKTTQGGDGFVMGLPEDIKLSGSIKPVLSFPVLEGEVINDSLIELTWDDSSITHTGYLIYRSHEPIPVDTTQDPYMELGRDVKQFDDSFGIPENTAIYYRVTPRTVYGNLFSNQIELSNYTSKIITFMMQESPTYTPIRVDNNILPLVPDTDTEWDGLNARFEQLNVLDVTLMSEYIPTPTYIEMRNYNE